MKTHPLICAGVLTALIAIGCQNTVNTVENTDKSMSVNTINDTRFVTDGYLKDRLALKKVNVSKTADGFLQVQLEAVNVRTGGFAQIWSGLTQENPYQIRYKFSWFDQGGMAVDTVLSDWQDATVIPGETVYLRSVAPSKNCKDFKISLREAN
ncbi:MAG: YcfL family protein [Victivallaceae bacterium]|nr:YcfL family protein [Victivallaceae bacterium]